ncbi:putative rhomboid-related protein 4 [Apostichopus japonicus]|uniref:Putative rhomboid-related protein 4 n=1 Tax=Stichopus japonicus TaxID=307972 RepID=A0A2G8KIK9_STIJA|nr:putative rhomboid-related protein 4 [Apostichopus japonicus]
MFRPRRRHGHHGRRREGLGLALLAMQLYQVGINRIPPTTLVTIGLNVAIYMRALNSFFKSFIRHPGISNICVSTSHVLYRRDWPRLLLAAWFHLDEWHLYYNMASFLWKGIQLERRLGTLYFAYLIAVFSVLTNIVMVGVNIAAAEVLSDDSYLVSCAAGFSGVIFALKVLSTHYSPRDSQSIMGFINVPSRWACWIELVVIQLIVPRASFTGHLAGILVGLAYVKGPLKSIMDIGSNAIISIGDGFHNIDAHHREEARSYRYQAGTSGYSERHQDDDDDDGYRGQSEEEQIQEAMRRSRETAYPQRNGYQNDSGGQQRNEAPPSSGRDYQRLYPDLSSHQRQDNLPYPEEDSMPLPHSQDEIRRRRLARFDQ